MDYSENARVQDAGNRHSWIERIGIPRPLFWGFVAVFVFMIGDGVESNYISPYIASQGFSYQFAGTVITIYGAAVAIASWFAGTLSTIWGPRRIMWLGGRYGSCSRCCFWP